MPSDSFLSQVTIFSELSESDQTALYQLFDCLSYKDEDWICREGDSSSEFFIVKSGYVNVVREIEGKETFLVTMGSGEYFGEAALFHDQKRIASVRASGDKIEILRLNRKRFDTFVQANPRTANLIFSQMLREMFVRLERTARELAFNRTTNEVDQSEIDSLISRS